MLLIPRPDSAVEMWGLSGTEGGAGAGWHEHIWRQAAITLRVAGQPSWRMHMHCASPGELWSWRASRKGTIWKVCGIFIFFSRLYQNKRSKKEKKETGEENLETRSYRVNDERVIKVNELLQPSHGPDGETEAQRVKGTCPSPNLEGEAKGPAEPLEKHSLWFLSFLLVLLRF